MTNLGILFKNNFNILLGSLQGKKERKSVLVATSILVLGVVGIFVLYSFQAWSMFEGLGNIGLEKLCVFHGITTALTVMLIIGVMRIAGNPKSSDTDFLLSLPIKRRDIILTKTINKYLFDLFFSFVLLLPFVLFYQVKTGFSISMTISGLVVVFLLPCLSVGVTYICDFIVSRVFNRFRTANLLKSIFSVLIFIIIMGLMMIKTFTYGTVMPETLEMYFLDRPITNLFLDFICNHQIIPLIASLAICVVPFVLGIILYSINFGKSLSSYHATSQTLKFRDGKSSFGSLFKKELNYYGTTPAYIVNTIIGPILTIAFAVLFASMGLEQINSFLMGMLSQDVLIAFVALLFCAFGSLTTISACSISLEGKNLWLLKSTPIDEKKLFFTKASLHIWLTVPFVVVASIILAVMLKLSILEFAIILFIPSLFHIIMAFGGLLINIWLPKFNWEEETQVVKQGLSVLVAMLMGLVLTLIPVGIYLLLPSFSIAVIALITFAIYLLIGIIIVSLLFSLGIKMFRKISL